MAESIKEYLAFIDETGGAGLDFSKSGTSTHFILTAVLVESSKVDLVYHLAEGIANKYFQGSEIKSRGVKTLKRRQLILDEIIKMKCHFYTIVVHKRRLSELSEGYKYHHSFFKNLHGKIERELLRTFRYLKIVVDEHGDNKFMHSFSEYIKKKYQSGQQSFFQEQTLRFCDSESDRLVQIADFMAGTIALKYEEGKVVPEGVALVDSIPKIIISHYPYIPKQSFGEEIGGMVRGNIEIVSSISNLTAKNFLDELIGAKDKNKLAQIACLEYLLNEFCYGNPERYITAAEIADWLKESGRLLEATPELVTESVGRMRNSGVLISSRSNKPAGYKLPYSEQDLFDFVEHMNSKIMPMIEKVKICRNRVNTATGFKLDILREEKFTDIKEIISNL